MHRFKILSVVSLYLTLLTIPVASANTGNQHENCDGRIIVKFKEGGKNIAQLNKPQIARLQTADKGLSVTPRRHLSNGAHLVQRDKNAGQQSDAAYIKQLNQDPDIEYAECDARRRIHFTPNDLHFTDQWYLSETGGGINTEFAWDITRNETLSATVIAVIDTGILPHDDLNGTRILQGYDFFANDADPSDPGDATIKDECGTDDPTEDTDSSWHGTAITGIIAAELNNTVGIAGIDHNSDILPLRALGKCGGLISDISDAIHWAAGLHIDGVPDNDNPADVINLSFGSPDECSVTEQQAIDAAVAAGALVVVAAGNEGTDIDDLAPANCENVLVVTATTRQGGETCYTNTGARADIAAPGGNSNDGAPGCAAAVGDTIRSISNNGMEEPDPATDSYSDYAGTSLAAPMVSAAIGLIKGIDANLSNSEIESVLISTARAFPQGTTDSFGDCDTTRCGAGILDIKSAVELASGVDITPDQFSFIHQNNITAGSVITSNAISVSGINALSPISISGGQYSINSGEYSDASAWIAETDTVTLRITAAGTASTARTATLNIGGVSANFTVTTQAADQNLLDGGDGGGGGSTHFLLSGGFIFLLMIRFAGRAKTYK